MKVALVHYWLVGMRGGEKVLEALCELYPDADIVTHVVDAPQISDTITRHTISTTFIASLPFAKRWYKNYLPFMPLALEQIDLTDYDLVISSESGPAKGVITRPDAIHICYCHTPMRYVWDMTHTYLRAQNWLKRALMRPLLHYVRAWDFQSAARVDHFVCNSAYVKQRVNKFYRRSAEVIHPPVDINRFKPHAGHEGYYLVFGQLVNYKRVDIAIDAFNQLGLPLKVMGSGEELSRLQKQANDNIEFLGRASDETVNHHLSHCRALIFPGIEDFGIVPLEAMACGTPVIAYAEGGALETVIDEKTGLLFKEQNATSLAQAVQQIESGAIEFDPHALHAHAKTFSTERFKKNMQAFIESKLSI